MFIAMNRFRVAKGSEAAFEHVWMSRDSHLDKVPGFVEFHLLKGPEAEDHTLYASHTVWENRAVFEAWTKSERSGQRIELEQLHVAVTIEQQRRGKKPPPSKTESKRTELPAVTLTIGKQNAVRAAFKGRPHTSENC